MLSEFPFLLPVFSLLSILFVTCDVQACFALFGYSYSAPPISLAFVLITWFFQRLVHSFLIYPSRLGACRLRDNKNYSCFDGVLVDAEGC